MTCASRSDHLLRFVVHISPNLASFMNGRLLSRMALAMVVGLPLCARGAEAMMFSGAVDGSAAVPVGTNHFIAATD